MEPTPSDFLIDQRLRNGLMEETFGWARGNAGIAGAGPAEHFESFFDWRAMTKGRKSTALTDAEAIKAEQLTALIEQAYADFARDMSADDLIATGWPGRIQPIAIELFDLLMDRGRFFENESEAKELAGWPWLDRNPVPGSRHSELVTRPAPHRR